MKDRMYYGFIAGIIAGIAQSAITFFLNFVKFADKRLFDFTSEILYGRLPLNAYDSILAYIVAIGFSGVLGIGYAYLIPLVSSDHYRFKGVIYSVFVWFAIYTVTALFKLPDLYYTTPYTATTNLIAAIVYGLVLAEVTKRLISSRPAKY